MNVLMKLYFNTTLVLFKHFLLYFNVLMYFISIPHWFYSNANSNSNIGIHLYPFQYHTGSIQTERFKKKQKTYRYFNTTLVLFKHKRSEICGSCDNWFQYHTGSIQTRKLQKYMQPTKSFQYHTGSIQTGCALTEEETSVFQYHTGSIQTYFVPLLVASFVISIPHWFYSNKMLVRSVKIIIGFQYHTGSIQTGKQKGETKNQMEFQYHTGSIQTDSRMHLHRRCVWFQYHTGSIQTNFFNFVDAA